MAKKPAKAVPTLSTAQRLSTIVKGCRDLMRKDKGLNGDIDRLPILTWIMFLKFLDDLEQLQETEAKLRREKYIPAINAPYRWRDWAHNQGLTGNDLLAFISQEKCTLPDGSEGLGLFYYLRGLQSESGRERRDVIATVFRGTTNRMINGYLLRDVVNKMDGIHFNSSEEVFTLAHLYESLLREMRDAAGDSGEFYTPRPVVKFMVDVLDPRIGESVLDPATGTAGFLAAAFDYLKPQCKTLKDREILQRHSIKGGEAKPLPYLLSQMNLLLHGLEYPELDYGNSLRHKLSELGDDSRVDVILTNPPFGGEEEAGIQNNFPAGKQTAETALLFMQLIMRRLRVAKGGKRGGRAAVVVPNGTLFADGVANRVKQQLLKDFNLHTIVRLPEGVFAPYTDISANVLFFEQGHSTNDIWYYEVPVSDGRRKYSKTKPLQPNDLDPLRLWWNDRNESPQAWRVDVRAIICAKEEEAKPHYVRADQAREEISIIREKLNQLFLPEDQANKLKSRLRDAERQERESRATGESILLSAYNLDHKNPHREAVAEHRRPEELIASIIEKQHKVIDLIKEVSSHLPQLRSKFAEAISNADWVPLQEVAPITRRPVTVQEGEQYPELGIRGFGRGTFHKPAMQAEDITWQKPFWLHAGDLVFSNIKAWEGAIAVVEPENHGRVGSHRYISCVVDPEQALPEFLLYYLLTPDGMDKINEASPGSADRNRTLNTTKLKKILVPKPSLVFQREFVQLQNQLTSIKKAHENAQHELELLFPNLLDRAFRGAL